MIMSIACIRGSRLGRNPLSLGLMVVLIGLHTAGCGEALEETPAPPLPLESASSMLTSDNGMGTNGMGTNGLSANGLNARGLSTSGMNDPAFVSWFNQDPVLAESVMKYVVACAVNSKETLRWTHPTTGVTYRWKGNLGLTPAWAQGAPATETEEQLLTACLAAHVNKYGKKVFFSVQGRDARGSAIPSSDMEHWAFPYREACFFGNIFRNEGVYAGNASVLPSTHSSVRACGLEAASTTVDQCPPIHHVASCDTLCVPDSTNQYFLSCTYNGKSYRALATRIQSRDIYVCGDGVCQISESCGSGHTPDNCMDCGPCP